MGCLTIVVKKIGKTHDHTYCKADRTVDFEIAIIMKY